MVLSTNFKISLVVLLFFAGSAASQMHSGSEPIEIRGQVRFAQGGAPVDNVVVRLEALSGGFVGEERTDRLGKFRFSKLSPAQYFVFVSLPGYREIRREVNLIMQASDYIQIQLVPEGHDSGLAPTGAKILDAKVPPEALKEFRKSEAALHEKKTEEGIRHLQRAINIYPDFVEAYLSLGTVYMDANDWTNAEQNLKRAVELSPKTVNALFALGELYFRQKNYVDSERVLRQGLDIEPRSWLGHFTLGRVYWDKGDIQRAGKQIALTLQLNPNLADAHLLAGNILLRAHKLDDAQVEYEEYLRLSPKGQFAAQAREAVQRIKATAGRQN